ncbi:pyocin activator PrtN family protein [Maritalea sp. P4.10X]|uniref:Pyocin activator PrtN family protein n=2 Tax=Maritalea mediterranea TaxID=2909667 RepID=A0ABS9E6B7_9HYPH|nr:pyocin activator PrtN family protein [Maritalea mediterranea]MCF4098357.1 pyocin activator PrtN family protein [Maritalea mediterranea]
MNTTFLLMAKYDGLPIIPAQQVCEDFFPHLTLPKFLRKVSEGQIPLQLVRIENSQKSARGVHIQDLAAYIDDRRKAAHREYKQMYG